MIRRGTMMTRIAFTRLSGNTSILRNRFVSTRQNGASLPAVFKEHIKSLKKNGADSKADLRDQRVALTGKEEEVRTLTNTINLAKRRCVSTTNH